MEIHEQLSIDYSDYWRPRDLDAARRMILTRSNPRFFERAGKRDATTVSRYLCARARVLDFGCGIGRVIKYLPPCRVIFGVDVSSDMLDLAKNRLSDRNDVILVNDDGSTFPLQIPFLDTIYSFWTFQHLTKQDALSVMTRLARALKRGGYVVYSFTSIQTSDEKGAQVRGWSLEEITQAMSGLGIRKVDSWKDVAGKYFVFVGQKVSLIRPWRLFATRGALSY